MKHLPSIFLCAVLFLTGTVGVSAQSGMEFSEFQRKIEPYFADELIDDLRAAMPQGAQYRIWGWDVGDFSGDGIYDVAFTVNVLGTRKRECIVYLFIDNEGFLVNIARFPLAYVDLPLEIGVVIRNTACYVTQKRKADYWTIKGYQYRDGAVVLLDEFVSDKIGTFGHEAYRNFQSLETRERYLTPKGETEFQVDYLTIPTYARGRQIYAGYVNEVHVDAVRNVNEGAFWWQGPTDASFSARLVYDDDFLYVRINVMDSTIVTGWCDTCPADRFDIWLDVTPAEEVGGSRYVAGIDRNGLKVRAVSDSGLFAFSVKIGDFGDIRPSIKVRTTDELAPEQEAAVQQVRVVTAQRSDGYVIKVRIPFVLLGYDKAPIDDKVLTELGCTLALYDVDNEFRPEETTKISTSAILPLNPSTYGAVRFIPDGLWYGETTNIYTDAVMSYLQELGF